VRNDGSGSRLGSYDTSMYPGSGGDRGGLAGALAPPNTIDLLLSFYEQCRFFFKFALTGPRQHSKLGNPASATVPRFRALHSRGKTSTFCLVVYSQHTVAYRAPRAVLFRGRRRCIRSLYSKGPGPLI
jgi:hypothetical protein